MRFTSHPRNASPSGSLLDFEQCGPALGRAVLRSGFLNDQGKLADTEIAPLVDNDVIVPGYIPDTGGA